jgi:type II secretory pathway predicted ATPase ExeA
MDQGIPNNITPSTKMVKCATKCSRWGFSIGWRQKDSQRPMAIITKVFHGRDCNVRTVELKTKDSVLVRPIVDVCLLEECNT